MMLKEGKSIEQPTYSYLTCTRQPETIHIEPREVVIIEGILALCDKKLRNIMDLKIFVDADPDERLIRVIQRDVIERGRTAEAVMEHTRSQAHAPAIYRTLQALCRSYRTRRRKQ
jgi:uridine kinase